MPDPTELEPTTETHLTSEQAELILSWVILEDTQAVLALEPQIKSIPLVQQVLKPHQIDLEALRLEIKEDLLIFQVQYAADVHFDLVHALSGEPDYALIEEIIREMAYGLSPTITRLTILGIVSEYGDCFRENAITFIRHFWATEIVPERGNALKYELAKYLSTAMFTPQLAAFLNGLINKEFSSVQEISPDDIMRVLSIILPVIIPTDFNPSLFVEKFIAELRR